MYRVSAQSLIEGILADVDSVAIALLAEAEVSGDNRNAELCCYKGGNVAGAICNDFYSQAGTSFWDYSLSFNALWGIILPKTADYIDFSREMRKI